MSIRMLDPTIASEAPQLEAPSKLATLDGGVVALFSNGKLNADLVLELSAEIIQRRFTPERFVLLRGPIDQTHAMSDEVHAKERFDAALVAIGD
jgi:hypothetical protein